MLLRIISQVKRFHKQGNWILVINHISSPSFECIFLKFKLQTSKRGKLLKKSLVIIALCHFVLP